MKFSVLGAKGFIGKHLADALEAGGHEVLRPGREDPVIFSERLGHVMYCIGLTADFRERPFDTMRAHICLLMEVLEKARFESLLYLSSTRIYANSLSTHEDDPVCVNAAEPEDLYNVSKLAGESLCLGSGRENVRVARLSNVYGNGMPPAFLRALIEEALKDAHVVLRTTFDSAKDYVSVDDVVDVLPKITFSGSRRVYNVASGKNVTNGELTRTLSRITGAEVAISPEAKRRIVEPISVDRVRSEFAFRPRCVLDDLADVVSHYRSGR